VIVLVLTAIGVATALLTPTRVRRLADLRLVGLWLVWTALLVQLVVFEIIGQHVPMWSSNALHLLSYALCVAFLWRNRAIPGGWIIAVGTACNLIVISANGGTMPANAAAWERAGLPEFAPDVFENSRALSSPRVAWLGDVFAIPAGWPLANVFSIGDVLIVIGGTYLAHRWCATPAVNEQAGSGPTTGDRAHDGRVHPQAEVGARRSLHAQ
jgi:hypothetical protein